MQFCATVSDRHTAFSLQKAPLTPRPMHQPSPHLLFPYNRSLYCTLGLIIVKHLLSSPQFCIALLPSCNLLPSSHTFPCSVVMSVSVASPRDLLSTRSLVDKERKAKPIQVKRFNYKILERPLEKEVNPNTMTLQHVELPYEEKRQRAEKLRTHSFRWALLNAVLTSAVIVCAFADNELSWYGHISVLQSSGLRALVVAISAIQLAVTVKCAQYKLKRRKLQGFQHFKSTLYPASLLYDRPHLLLLFAEMAHIGIVMPPWVDFKVNIEHNGLHYHLKASDFVTMAIFLRVYHIFHFLYSQSPYHSQRAQFYT